MARIEAKDTRVSAPKVETKPQTNPETNPQNLSTVTKNSFTGRDSKLGELSTRESQMRAKIRGETPPAPPDLAAQATVMRNGSQVIIDAGAGNDVVYAGGGRDYINGSTGEDRLYGCGSDDVLYSGQGTDNLTGATGNNSIYAQTATDMIQVFAEKRQSAGQNS